MMEIFSKSLSSKSQRIDLALSALGISLQAHITFPPSETILEITPRHNAVFPDPGLAETCRGPCVNSSTSIRECLGERALLWYLSHKHNLHMPPTAIQ